MFMSLSGSSQSPQIPCFVGILTELLGLETQNKLQVHPHIRAIENERFKSV
jgi:hypothetical protein